MRRACGILIVSAVAATSAAFAEEVVHFTNGAEMTVRGHAIEKDMVKLDLDGASSIAFPMSMVDKIVSAGKNVFLNPNYHPSNQAVPADPSSLPEPLPDRGIRGGGAPVGYRLGQSKTGTGLRMGEASNDPGEGSPYGGSGRVTTVSDDRQKRFSTPQPRKFDSLYPDAPGARQTIEPPSGGPAHRTATGIQIRVSPTDAAGTDPQAPPPPSETESQETPPPPPPQDPPESD